MGRVDPLPEKFSICHKQKERNDSAHAVGFMQSSCLCLARARLRYQLIDSQHPPPSSCIMKTGAELTAHIMQRVAAAAEKKWATNSSKSLFCPLPCLFPHFQLKLGKRPSNIIFNRCPVSLFVFFKITVLIVSYSGFISHFFFVSFPNNMDYENERKVETLLNEPLFVGTLVG